ncbi:M15 family metallopeptidase [uncultured Granulicatella sp.]|uniref:M15 family metallopeptidase n=1 Tax=uncultured Granulicatella sp. TaxID=316089 RepID=UPI0028D60294|nr:M15 family metallopeptidase [uncultured Granulicatella sp.]
MMKKFIYMVASLAFLTACHSTTTENKTETTQTTATAEQTSVATKQSNGEADLSLGIQMVVNKKHKLPADYNPGENPNAGKNVREIIKKMQELGFSISNQYSGFRSYEYQTKLYQNYVNKDGKEAADTYSARPGYSEHQTGLAFDILNGAGGLLGENPQDEKAIEWLHSHAHEYGFIVRFQEGKEAITGYQAEAWHLRYVGDIAEKIYTSNLTLEEYFGVEGGNYAD